ncbi:MAG: YggU family protein [Blastocatellia bacterium]|nr:YggU family protein [Blastocatellia bacterium]
MSEDLTISIRVIPRASRSEIVGMVDGTLKVRIAAPPVDGAANSEIIKLFSKTFGIAKSDIAIISGETSRNKRIKFTNLSQSKFDEKIL